jgi:hypothetical protein
VLWYVTQRQEETLTQINNKENNKINIINEISAVTVTTPRSAVTVTTPRSRNWNSGFCREVYDKCELLGYYAACSVNYLRTFRDHISVTFLRFKNLLGLSILEYRTHRLSRNISKELPLHGLRAGKSAVFCSKNTFPTL